MKAIYRLTLATFAGVAIGAAGVYKIHAQADGRIGVCSLAVTTFRMWLRHTCVPQPNLDRADAIPEV